MLKINKIITLFIFISILIIIFKVFIKLLPIILIFVVVLFFPYQKLLGKILNLFIKKHDFQSAPEQLYKQCSYCKKRADINVKTCDFCGKPFE